MPPPKPEYYVLIFNGTVSEQGNMTLTEVLALITAMLTGDKLIITRISRGTKIESIFWEELAA